MEADWIDAEPGEFTERTYLSPDEARGLPYQDASRMHVLRGNYERSAEQQAERDAELAQITMRPAHLKKLKSGELGRRVMLSEIGLIEAARTGASGCKVCHAKIAKGAVRLGIYCECSNGLHAPDTITDVSDGDRCCQQTSSSRTSPSAGSTRGAPVASTT